MIEHIKCLRCGRRLKNAESRQLGYGQICWEKANIVPKNYTLFDISDSDVPTTSHATRTRDKSAGIE